MSDIYAGKPFLRLLDAYVLDAIGDSTPKAMRHSRGKSPSFARCSV